ncbi:hypothetical protein BC834DRAFT_891861 [Gloeopeniophorella convolvens]|nr:hypothetical protein BC834DRAFT_891861 [Gloeopeniophorella convolvens]
MPAVARQRPVLPSRPHHPPATCAHLGPIRALSLSTQDLAENWPEEPRAARGLPQRALLGPAPCSACMHAPRRRRRTYVECTSCPGGNHAASARNAPSDAGAAAKGSLLALDCAAARTGPRRGRWHAIRRHL